MEKLGALALFVFSISLIIAILFAIGFEFFMDILT
jgi:hypothetical protein